MASIRDRISNVDAVIESSYAGTGIPGLAVGIVHGGHLVHVKCLGVANATRKTRVDQTTAFRLASISKTLTMIGLLQLWEAGKLQLTDPVNKYLPKGKVEVRNGWPEVTITHLLTHQAGIGEMRQKRDLFKKGYGLLVKGRDAHVPPLSTIHDIPLRPEVAAGTKYAYSNIGFSLLGYVIEQVSGESFREYMIRHVLDPVGMVHSDFLPTGRIGSNEAAGYKRSFGRVVPATYYQNVIAPAGNLISSIDDMARYTAMLLAKGALPGGGRMLKAETIEMAFSPHHWASDSLKHDVAMGLCFHLYRINGVQIVEHTGATSGFTSAMSLVPSEDLAVLVFSNMDEIFGARRTLEIKHAVIEALVGKDSPPPSGVAIDPAIMAGMPGYYGPLPGVLTNTRIIGYYGGDFKVRARGGSLYLSSFYGSRRNGVELLPVDGHGHFVVDNPRRPTARKEHVAALFDAGGHVTGIALEHFTLPRRPFMKTLRFHVYLLCLAVIAGIAALVLVASLRAI
ncbi:MAG: beta-lactamase family protein [Candidatus Lokiarchaeota archaeon]|nr:beta-lactamase family protein [Candidatus Lokiarchaeota archaeon]